MHSLSASEAGMPAASNSAASSAVQGGTCDSCSKDASCTASAARSACVSRPRGMRAVSRIQHAMSSVSAAAAAVGSPSDASGCRVGGWSTGMPAARYPSTRSTAARYAGTVTSLGKHANAEPSRNALARTNQCTHRRCSSPKDCACDSEPGAGWSSTGTRCSLRDKSTVVAAFALTASGTDDLRPVSTALAKPLRTDCCCSSPAGRDASNI